MDDDLSLISTDDLVEELVRRFDAVVVVASQERTEGERLEYFRNHGDLHLCIGLAQTHVTRMAHRWVSEPEDNP